MKFYPKKASKQEPDRDGFTESEINDGTMYLLADVQCHDCGHVMSLAMAGSIDYGKCIRCGGKTS